jgi:predicted GNAT family acetyltransferase
VTEPAEPVTGEVLGLGRIELSKNTEAGQYELRVEDALVGLATYRQHDGVIVLPHTETAPAFGGRGLASKLVEFSLDDIRAQGAKVEPACPFVREFIANHPAYLDLLAPS